MRHLSERQWNTYFRVVERVRRLPPAQRPAALQSLREEITDRDVASLVDLHFCLPPEFDRRRDGERIRNFVLREPLGRGGMGVVYRAVQQFAPGVEREVAVKLIHPELLLGEGREAARRFNAEIGALVRLEHPGIARIYDGGSYRDDATGERTLFFAMQWVRGESLNRYVARHGATIGVAGVLRVFLRACDALEHAHRSGVVHRDLKPSNILVDGDGRPHVIDFGLARALDDPDGGEAPGQIIGTRGYLSPERQAGEPSAPASDVYSLGVILRELASDCGWALDANDQLARVIDKATAAAKDRYASVAAFGRELISWLRGIGAKS